jgi:hypothetical protein
MNRLTHGLREQSGAIKRPAQASQASNLSWRNESMTDKIPRGPEKRPETETPTVINSSTDAEEQKHKKMERMADRAAHKANKDEQNFDQDHNTFSNI